MQTVECWPRATVTPGWEELYLRSAISRWHSLTLLFLQLDSPYLDFIYSTKQVAVIGHQQKRSYSHTAYLVASSPRKSARPSLLIVKDSGAKI